MTEEQLRELYIVQRQTSVQIAERMQLPVYKVRYMIRHLKLHKNERNIETNTSPKICPHCNEVKPRTEFYQARKPVGVRSGSWCKQCMTQSVIERDRLRKAEAVTYKGGKCMICGYCRCLAALEFHHLNPTTKETNLARFKGPLAKIQFELDKCALLCCRCHRELENGVITLDPKDPT